MTDLDVEVGVDGAVVYEVDGPNSFVGVGVEVEGIMDWPAFKAALMAAQR